LPSTIYNSTAENCCLQPAKLQQKYDAKNPAQSAENTGGKYCSKQPSIPPSILAYSAQSAIYNLHLFSRKYYIQLIST
jgi:hypothetical protein